MNRPSSLFKDFVDQRSTLHICSEAVLNKSRKLGNNICLLQELRDGRVEHRSFLFSQIFSYVRTRKIDQIDKDYGNGR